jgi:hypothetical protein
VSLHQIYRSHICRLIKTSEPIPSVYSSNLCGPGCNESGGYVYYYVPNLWTLSQERRHHRPITEDGHLEDTASEWEEEDEKEYIPINSETGKITKYKILRITKDLVVVKTNYWVKEECEEKGMCIIRH